MCLVSDEHSVDTRVQGVSEGSEGGLRGSDPTPAALCIMSQPHTRWSRELCTQVCQLRVDTRQREGRGAGALVAAMRPQKMSTWRAPLFTSRRLPHIPLLPRWPERRHAAPAVPRCP